MNLVFVQKLGLHIQKINVGTQKIDGSALETFKIIIANLEMEDKTGKSKFFQKTFLVANTQFEAVLGMFFLKISNTDVSFGEMTLTWKSYTTKKTLSTTKQVQIVNLKEFVIAAWDVDSETLVIYIAIWEWKKWQKILSKKLRLKLGANLKSGS